MKYRGWCTLYEICYKRLLELQENWQQWLVVSILSLNNLMVSAPKRKIELAFDSFWRWGIYSFDRGHLKIARGNTLRLLAVNRTFGEIDATYQHDFFSYTNGLQ